jgi:hypothetical protein
MADVTGPISSLPGSRHDPPEGTKCDQHPDRPAVVRMQGETDSFGCEMYDLCAECAAEWKREAAEPDLGCCDWCEADNVARSPQRDFDEGMHGPVYYVCKSCRDRYDAELRAELGQFGD